MTIEWRNAESKWQSGEFAYLGKIRFAHVFWDSSHSKESPDTHRVGFLMQQPPKSMAFPSEKEAKQYAEKGIAAWLKWANLTDVEAECANKI